LSHRSIVYRFKIPNSPPQQIEFNLRFDDETMKRIDQDTGLEPDPAWTKLTNHRCANCPLNENENSNCPAATSLIPVVKQFTALTSFDELELIVEFNERTITTKTNAQRALSSLMGLLIATSDCPRTEFLRPMARFHLPTATEEETATRAVSNYLIGQYFRHKKGLTADIELEGLSSHYRHLRTVNKHLSDRIREQVESDASVNAIILLDMMASALPYHIEEQLEEISQLFEYYLHPID